MLTFDHTTDRLDSNLALDEALLLSAEAGESDEVLRFWEWPTPAVVLGAGGSIAIDVDEQACVRDGVPIARRASGGGTVLLGRGCLLFSLVLAYDRDPDLRDVNRSYRWILDRVRFVLSASLSQRGTSDLAVDDVKVSGNAQQRKQRHFLHHGTLLYDFDLSTVDLYLKPPEREPDYRGGRDHASFVSNLQVDAATFKSRMVQAFDATPGEVPPCAFARVPTLLAERYDKPEWVRRR